ncbi:MAG: flavodoxin family protein [Nitrospirota bacterium]
MNVIAFMGSPRRGGNTETLLKEALGGAGLEARVFDLNDMQIKPCQHCGGCEDTGQCIIPDDMEQVSSAIRAADRIILSTPVFFSGVSAQAKAMIDRCQQFWCEKYLLKKEIPAGEHGRRGLLLVVGGMKNAQGVECVGRTAKAWFRSVSVPEHRTLAYTGVDAMGDILKHPTALRDALEAGRELVK